MTLLRLPFVILSVLLCLVNLTNGQATTSDANGINLLGSDFSLLLENGVLLTPSLAESTENCQTPYRILQICLRSECPDFTNVCPTNTSSNPQNTGRLTCTGIAETICTTYKDCCMTDCALELQTLAICVGENGNNNPKGLVCEEPSCDDSVLQNTTTEAPTDPNLRECELVDTNDQGQQHFICQHVANVTSIYSTNTKPFEADIICSVPPDGGVGFDYNDCQCQGATVFGEFVQECSCQICNSSPGKYSIALDCRNDILDPFVIDDCIEQTCQGGCIRMPPDVPSIMPTTSAQPTQPMTIAQPINPTPAMPSTAPSIQSSAGLLTTGTGLPTLGTGLPTSSNITMAPSQESSTTTTVLTYPSSSSPSVVLTVMPTKNQPSLPPSLSPAAVTPSHLRRTSVPTVAPSTMSPSISPRTPLPIAAPPPPTVSPIRQNSTLASFVGALLATIGLIVVLVVAKKGNITELTRVQHGGSATSPGIQQSRLSQTLNS
ncbi:expressed unknown protein [Seminavis robusta]|uniref:Uncharacterized protein n=1 Tax=Seminavis robusta TaxID=568900 RepID=A0A9N8DHR7_9STRA|nr:expressed unknown protein [Seminavis robusta]|eukprot:Sro91_g047800.1 n/a (491) ;mRNA; f:91093-92565